MPVSARQLAAFVDTHAWRIPFDTSPRHLAGPGDARHVTHGLAAAGWTCTSDPLSPEIALHSPDRRYSLTFDPQSPTSAWWRLQAEPTTREPGWYTEFGEFLPAEILGYVTDTLVAPLPVQQQGPFQVLEMAGWVRDSTDTARSTDGMCYVQRRLAQDDARVSSWRIEACKPGHGTPMGPRIWHAWFSDTTPEYLVSAFITALADPAPLQRGMYEGLGHYSAVQQPSPLTSEQVVAAHTRRLDAIRVQARAARRQQGTTLATTPARPGVARSAARR